MSIQITTIDANTEDKLSVINTNFTTLANAITRTVSAASGTNHKSAIIRYGAALAVGVTIGDLVYFNSNQGCFDKALAELADPASNGSSVESEKARVMGMVIDIDSSQAIALSDGTTGTTGTLLCGGFYTSTACVEACLGTSPLPGTYYLSPTTPGKAVQVTEIGDRLQQPVLTYMGDGLFSFSIFYMAHDNHFHSYAEIDTTSWVSVESDTLSGYMAHIPEGLGTVSTDLTALFVDGRLTQWGGVYGISTDTTSQYITKNTTEVPTETIILFNHYPFAYGSPVVRGVRAADGSRFSISTKNGIATITADEYDVVNGDGAITAVTSIQGGTVTTTPVVSSIDAGNGIVINTDQATGKCTIHTNTLAGNRLTPDIINYNGAVYTSDGIYSNIQIATGTSSNIVIQKSIYNVSSTDNLVFSVFVEVSSIDEGPILIKPWFLNFDPDNQVEKIDPETKSAETVQIVGGTTNTLIVASGTVTTAITGAGTMFAQISNNGPTAVNIHRLGFYINTGA